jgi:hypothetical protein
MPNDNVRQRQKAVKLARRAKEEWETIQSSRRLTRSFRRAAYRAQTPLFRIICADLHDPAPRLAYGEIAILHSWVQSFGRGRIKGPVMADYSVKLARAALWAFNLAEVEEIEARQISLLMHEPPVESEFTLREDETEIFYAEHRIAMAADARLSLAERLAIFQPRPLDPGINPQVLDAILQGREKFRSPDELLVMRCQLESCRGRNGVDEARILTREAVRIYRILVDLGTRFGADDLADAERRRDKVLRQLPLDFG